MKAYERLLNYVKVPTPSNEKSGTHPSSECQRVLADQLAEAVQHIEGNYTAVEIAAPDVADAEAQRKTLPADPTVKNFSYTVVDGEIY